MGDTLETSIPELLYTFWNLSILRIVSWNINNFVFKDMKSWSISFCSYRLNNIPCFNFMKLKAVTIAVFYSSKFNPTIPFVIRDLLIEATDI